MHAGASAPKLWAAKPVVALELYNQPRLGRGKFKIRATKCFTMPATIFFLFFIVRFFFFFLSSIHHKVYSFDTLKSWLIILEFKKVSKYQRLCMLTKDTRRV